MVILLDNITHRQDAVSIVCPKCNLRIYVPLGKDHRLVRREPITVEPEINHTCGWIGRLIDNHLVD